MSKVTMDVRSENVINKSCKTQKRPLSIITEHEVDESGVISFTAFQQTPEALGEDKAPTLFDTLESNTDDLLVLFQQKITESRTDTTAMGQNKTLLNQSTFLQNSQPNVNVPFVYIYKPELYKNTAACKSINDASACISLNVCNKEQHREEEADLSKSSGSVISSDFSKTEIQNHQQLPYPDNVWTSLKTTLIHGSASIDNTRDLISSRNCEEHQDTTQIRKQTNQFTTQLSSKLSCHSSSANPKLGLRHLEQKTGSQNVNDKSDQKGQLIPQITITSIGEENHLGSQFCSTSSNVHEINNSNVKQSTDISSNMFTTDYSGSNYVNYHLTNRKSPNLNSKRTFNAHVSRKKSLGSAGSLPSNELIDSEGNVVDSPEDTRSMTLLSDFWRLKETTEKLHLSTRRPSTMLWRQKYIEGQGLPALKYNLDGDISDQRLTVDRKQRIDNALEWLQNELLEMRSQDQSLATQLLTIRQEIHQLKLQKSTEEHQDLIEEFQSELDDIQEFSDVLDIPQTEYGKNPLKHIGVTRLNISARRFSAC